MTRRLKLDAFLPYRLSIAANAVSKLIANAYADRFDLTVPEWRLIAVLENLSSASQQDLVARTLMDKVAVSRAASALEARGLILRDEDPSDGRARRLSLTQAGRALFAQVAPAALGFEDLILKDFAPDEVAHLTALLDRVHRAALAADRVPADLDT